MTEVPLETWMVEVMIDGGSRPGLIVLSAGKLAAVLIEVRPEETGRTDSPGGWYLEAGFGPCGNLLAVQPDIFVEQSEAMAWISQRLAHH